MHPHNLLRPLLAALALFAPAPSVRAGVMLDNTGGIAINATADVVGGYLFRVTSSITVSGLGLWDEGGNGLAQNHDVGLWNSNGSILLASTTITNASTPVASASPD